VAQAGAALTHHEKKVLRRTSCHRKLHDTRSRPAALFSQRPSTELIRDVELDGGVGGLRSELLFLASLHIEFVRGVEVLTEFTGCLIELDVFACPALGTDNFIRVNKPSEEAVEFMSALRVRALERVKQLAEKAEHDLPACQALLSHDN
jgi:hypothetical protein